MKTRKEIQSTNELQVEIISEENIIPTIPTPHHLKTYEVSILDQLLPHIYMPYVYFYPNDHPNNNHDDLISKRRQHLKQSLSKTLTKFYPLAGEVKDNFHIDCNDKGVYYVEAKVTNRLKEFLHKPENKFLHKLLPVQPKELFTKPYLVMIQITLFSCGGIAIGLYTSHKLIYGYSLLTFLKAWSTTCSSSSEEICPNFISPLIFPSNHMLPKDRWMFRRSLSLEECKNATRRFVFNSSNIVKLKNEANASSHVMAISAFLWKCVIKTLKVSKDDYMPMALEILVDLRKRSSPPMEPYSIGNILWNSYAHKWVDDDLRLDLLAKRLKKSLEEINSDFIERMKGKDGFVEEMFNKLMKFHYGGNVDHLLVTNGVNSGIYQTDFGWGKPIWASFAFADINSKFLTNFVLLMDTRSGKGIEAWVTLTEEDMVVFERDSELLSFSSLNPSPLESVE